MEKRNLEILAPCGSYESLLAAVRSKADAVYLGAGSFNARMKADAFSGEDLKEVVGLCHSHNMKVHVTMNTLISDGEISAALAVLKDVCQSGADAVILQDLGFADLVKKAAPDLEMHASTQMSVQTASGMKLLKEMGFKRGVLPREATKGEIKKISEETDIQLEAFVHGAHCMCVSGQCYMSSLFGGRSGNRGLCAQPCRLPFSAANGTGFDLSLKDLSLTNRLDELAQAGVISLKIEGRMKRPEYVAAAVTAVRKNRDGEAGADMQEKLKAVFSRSGFTSGYFDNSRGRDMFGTRQKEDVTSATNSLLKDLAKLYEKEVPRIGVAFHLTILEGEKISLSASAQNNLVFVSDETVPEKALSKPLTKEALKDRLSKCGGTQFFVEECEIDLDEGLIVPASVINSLRREALSLLDEKLKAVKAKSFTEVDTRLPENRKSTSVKWNLRVASIGQIPDNLQNVENLFIPLMTAEKYAENLNKLPVSVGIEVPRGIFGGESVVEKRLMMWKSLGFNKAYCGTLDAVSLAKKCGMEIHTGFSLNVFNSHSARVLESLGVKAITLSPELKLTQIEKFSTSAKRDLIAYGRLPLMLTRNCPVKNGTDCEACKASGYLTDRLGKKFPVMCNFGCSEVLNSQPVYMGDRLSEIKNVDYLTFYFTRESKSLCEAVLDAYRKGKSVKGDYTRGLYYRGTE